MCLCSLGINSAMSGTGALASSLVSLRQRGCCWRIQSQPRKLFKFDRIKRISSLFGGFANSTNVAASTRLICQTRSYERLEKQAQANGQTITEVITQLVEEIEAAHLSAVVRQMQAEGLFAEPPAAPPQAPIDFQPIQVLASRCRK